MIRDGGPNPDTAERSFRLPFLLFVGDVKYAKTARGLVDWRRDDCCAQWRLSPDAMDLGLPDADAAAGVAMGAGSLLIGASPIGGSLPRRWVAHLAKAAILGLDLVSGLHEPLAEIPEVADAVARSGVSIHEVRQSRDRLRVGNGLKRAGTRVLTVGTDCGVGKKYTALALAKELQSRGARALFRATGQTGVMISGDGLAIDGVVADFATGAVEDLSPSGHPDCWYIIEGQGAIFHPAYSPVTLALLHGSQPDFLVLCHDPNRTSLSSFGAHKIRTLQAHIDTYLDLASVTNPTVELAAISLNTTRMPLDVARQKAEELEDAHDVPCFDPLRFDLSRTVDHIVNRRGARVPIGALYD